MKYNCVDIGYENDKINAKISLKYFYFISYIDAVIFHIRYYLFDICLKLIYFSAISVYSHGLLKKQR